MSRPAVLDRPTTRTFRIEAPAWSTLSGVARLLTSVEGQRVTRTDVLRRLLALGPAAIVRLLHRLP